MSRKISEKKRRQKLNHTIPSIPSIQSEPIVSLPTVKIITNRCRVCEVVFNGERITQMYCSTNCYLKVQSHTSQKSVEGVI